MDEIIGISLKSSVHALLDHYPLYHVEALGKLYLVSVELQQMRGLTFQQCYGLSISAHNAASLGSIHFPGQNA